MPSLAKCLERVGSKLSDFEKDQIKKSAKAYVDEGYDAKTANLSAVEDVLFDLENEKKNILEQVEKSELPDKNSFTLERYDRDKESFNNETFKRGEYVKAFINKDQWAEGEIIGINNVKREAKVKRGKDGVWFDFGSIYKAEKPKEPEKKLTPLSKVIDSVNKKNAPNDLLDEFNLVKDALYEGQTTPEELKKNFENTVANKEAIKEELSRLPKNTKKKGAPSLLKMLGSWKAQQYKNDKKALVVNAVYDNMLQTFHLGSSLSYNPFDGGGMEGAIRKSLESVAQEDIQKFADKVKKNTEEYKKWVEDQVKAIKNPETLEEFETFIEYNGKDKLSAEQQVKYDELKSAKLAEKKSKEKERKATVKSVDLGETGMKIIPGKHTKKGHDIWTVRLSDRVDKETFRDLKSKAKQLGGYYSMYRGNGAIPGFVFTEEGSANDFVSLQQSDVSNIKRVEERDIKKQDKAVKRLLAQAERMESASEEELNKDRLTNTHKRARQAASAGEAARRGVAFAKTLRQVAEKIQAGESTHLSGIRNKSQLDTLESILTRAKNDSILEQSRKDNNIRYEDERHREPTKEDVSRVEVPGLEVYRDHLNSMANDLQEIKGGKLLANQLRSRFKNSSGDYYTFKFRDKELIRNAIKKLNLYKKSTPGFIEENIARRDRLARMGIETVEQLRAALRELIELRSATEKEDPLKAKERELIGNKGVGIDFFPTPKPLAERLVDEAQIEKGMKVLEPSAGKGDIADAIKESGVNPDVVEMSSTLREFLELKKYNIVGRDFLEFEGEYDRIIMNPPFSKGMDVDHVNHAFKLLKPGGRIVAIMGEHPFFANDKKSKEFREWLDDVGYSEKLTDAFKGKEAFRQTGVNSRLVVIDKPGPQFSTKKGTGTDVTLKDVQKLFKGQHVGLSENGDIWVQTKSGRKAKITFSDTIEMSESDIAAFQAEYQRLPTSDETVAGKYQNGTIHISMVGDKLTLAHESTHWMEDAGVLNTKDVGVLKSHIQKLVKQNKFKPTAKDNIGGSEDRANFIAEQLNAENPKGIQAIMDKIKEFLDRVFNMIKRTEGGIVRDIKTGKIFDSAGTGSVQTKIPQFEKMAGKWFSQMTETLGKKLPGKGSPQQIKQMIKSWEKKGEIKAEELEWSGLVGWLNDQSDKISKQDILDYLAENNVRVEEVVIGEGLTKQSQARIDRAQAEVNKAYDDYHEVADEVRKKLMDAGVDLATANSMVEYMGRTGDSADSDSVFHTFEKASKIDPEYDWNVLYDAKRDVEVAIEDLRSEENLATPNATRYHDFQVAGGENYKELLLTMPGKKAEDLDARIREISNWPGDTETAKDPKDQKELDGLMVEWNRRDSAQNAYKSSHFDEPNILAHVRFNERTDADGNKVLFIEEVQSDWHQAGRKEGYKSGETTLGYGKQLQDKYNETNLDRILTSIATTEEVDHYYSLTNPQQYVPGVPDAPFKKTWPMLAMKRMVRYAAENGFHKIAWTSGEIQADRYDLSKQVDRIYARTSSKTNIVRLRVYQKEGSFESLEPSKNNLSDYVGKELADKILAQEVGRNIEYSGLDLKVGGEGMKGFYDKILPSAMNKFFNKAAWGKAKVQSTNLSGDLSKRLDEMDRLHHERGLTDTEFDEYQEMADGENALTDQKVWAIPITDKMKSKAMREGMPLFSVQSILKDTIKEAGNIIKDIPGSTQSHGVHRTNKGDFGPIAHMIATPLYLFRKFEASQRMYDHTVESAEEKLSQVYELTESGEVDVNLLNDTIYNLQKDHPREYEKLEKYLKKQDMLKLGDRLKQNGEMWELRDKKNKKLAEFTEESLAVITLINRELAQMRAKGFSPRVIKAVEAVRIMTNRGFDLQMRAMRELIERADQDARDKGYEVKQFRGKYAVFAENGSKMISEHLFDTEFAAWDSVNELPTISKYDEEGNVVEISLRVAMAEMGDMRGYYMPRSWEPGRIVLHASKDGENPIRKEFDLGFLNKDNKGWKNAINNLALPIGREVSKLKKDGYEVSFSEKEQIPEDLFEILGPLIGTSGLVNQALEKTGAIKGIDSLKDMGMKTRWRGGTTFIVEGANYNPKYTGLLESLGGEYEYKQVRGRHGTPTWTFRDAPDDIEEQVSTAIFELENINPNFEVKFATSLITEISNIFKARGGRSHMIRRSDATGENVVTGYETDPHLAVSKYIAGISATEAKHKLAMELVKDITGTWETWGAYHARMGEDADWNDYKALVKERSIEPAKQKKAFKVLSTYIKDVLRNQETIDRVVGTLKGVAVLKYIAYRYVAAPLVNITVLPTALPAAMSGYGDIKLRHAPKHIAGAMRQYIYYRFPNKFKNKLTREQKNLWAQIESRGWLQPQYDQEALSQLRSKSGRALNKIIDLGMVTFSAAETLNRAASIVGAYNGIIANNPDYQQSVDPNTGVNEKILKIAKDVSDRANQQYGKSNYPHLVRKTGAAGQSFFVFKTFSWGYLQTMADLGMKDPKATAWMLFTPAVLAGAGASVAMPVLAGLFGMGTDDDPEEWFYRKAGETFGPKGRELAQFGLVGQLGFSMSGNLSIDVGVGSVPTNLFELFGAPGSIIEDMRDAAQAKSFYRGVETAMPTAVKNAMKAWREYDEGVTSRTYSPVFYGKEQLQPDWLESALRSMSLNPIRIAQVRETQWKERVRAGKLSKIRSELYSKFKAFYLDPPNERSRKKYLKLLEEVREYNERAKAAGKATPVITGKSIRTNLKRAFKPSKLERLRETG